MYLNDYKAKIKKKDFLASSTCFLLIFYVSKSKAILQMAERDLMFVTILYKFFS